MYKVGRVADNAALRRDGLGSEGKITSNLKDIYVSILFRYWFASEERSAGIP